MAIYQLRENRVWRPFLGGAKLDALAGRSEGAPGHYPERWIASTTGTASGEGYSRLTDGRRLRDVLGRDTGVLVKLLDSYSRLMIQVHPDDGAAQRLFQQPCGKTECWYILDTQAVDGVEPFVFLGFRAGVTPARWREVSAVQDIPAMEAMLNRIPVKPGDCFLVPPGVPHAMGNGVFFAEAQQPSDLVFRTEYITPAGERLPDEALHLGAGFDAMFSCFDYRPSSPEAFRAAPQGDTILSSKWFSIFRPRPGVCYPAAGGVALVALAGEGTVNGVPLRRGGELYLDEDFEMSGGIEALAFTGPAAGESASLV